MLRPTAVCTMNFFDGYIAQGGRKSKIDYLVRLADRDETIVLPKEAPKENASPKPKKMYVDNRVNKVSIQGGLVYNRNVLGK